MPPAIWQTLGSGSYNGMNFGPTQKVHISAIAGAGDLPGIRASDSLKAFQHGHFRGTDLSAGRIIDITFLIIGDDNTDFLNQLGSLETATILQPTGELPLLLFNSTRLFNVRPRKRAVKYDAGYAQRQGTVDVQFVSSDPRVYDANLQTLNIPVSVSSGGAAWPWVWSVAWGTAGTSGVGTFINSGNFPTRCIAVFRGPVDNPQLQNATTGQYVNFAITLGATDTLTVDFSAHSVLLNGTASRRGTMTSGSQWFDLAPGSTQIIYSANTVQVGSTVTVQGRSSWL